MLTKRLRQEWREWNRREKKENFEDPIAREIRQEEMEARKIVSRRAKRKITHGPLT